MLAAAVEHKERTLESRSRLWAVLIGARTRALLGQLADLSESVVFTVECSVRRAMHGLFGLLDFVNGIPATYGRVTDAKVAMGASLGGLKSKNWSRS